MRRAWTPTSAVFLVAGFLSCLSCGGGTEIAPASPRVDGQGSATLKIDATTYGPTELVVSGVSGGADVPTIVTAEKVTFGLDDRAALLHGNLILAPVTVSGMGGMPVYQEGADISATCGGGPCDFWVEDRIAGILGRIPGGTIPAGSDVYVSYTYNQRALSINVGITFSPGQFASLNLFNVLPQDTAPFSISLVAASAPSGPPFPAPKAFDVSVKTGLTMPTGQQDFALVAATLDITRLDLSNPLNTCIAGHVQGTVSDLNAPDPTNRSTIDLTFDDSTC